MKRKPKGPKGRNLFRRGKVIYYERVSGDREIPATAGETR